MVCAKLHGGIDILYGSNAVRIDADRFVDHGNQNSVYHESGSLVHLNGSLSDLGGDGFDLLNHFIRGVQSCDHLNQLHDGSGIEEMHADHGSVQTCSDLRDGKGGGIGGEDAVRLADVLQLLKGLLLDLHVLKRSFHYKIAVRADRLHAGGDLCQDGVGGSLLHLSLGNSLAQPLGDPVLAVCGELFIDIAQKNLIAFGLGKSLCNTGTHGSCTDNTNFHECILLYI